MFKKVLNFILSGNVSDEDYKLAADDMYRNNVMMLRLLSSIATLIFITCIILGIYVDNMRSKMIVYLVGIAFSLCILASAFLSKNKKLHTICMCFLDVMLLGVGLLITLVSAPEQLTVTLIPVALLVPLFFDVKPCVFLTVVGVADLIYLVIAPIVKPSDILVLDIVDVLAFSFSGIMIGTIITKVKIERYALSNRFKKIALQDGLTECYNRKSYSDDTSNFTTSYPLDFIYVSLDLNGLKVVNDSLGHEAGDEIILGASHCMRKVLGKYGKVYRTGGDEFTAILYIGNNDLNKIFSDFENEVANWHGEQTENIYISYGYVKADEAQGMNILEVSSLADKRMYEVKANYYKNLGVDRRGQNEAYKTLCSLYTKILKINLTDDSYTIINMNNDEQVKERGFAANISTWLEGFGRSGQVHQDDLEEYLAKTNLDYMKKYFTRGKSSLSISYRRRNNDTFKHVVMEIVRTDNYRDDNQVLYLYVKEIDLC